MPRPDDFKYSSTEACGKRTTSLPFARIWKALLPRAGLMRTTVCRAESSRRMRSPSRFAEYWAGRGREQARKAANRIGIEYPTIETSDWPHKANRSSAIGMRRATIVSSVRHAIRRVPNRRVLRRDVRRSRVAALACAAAARDGRSSLGRAIAAEQARGGAAPPADRNYLQRVR